MYKVQVKLCIEAPDSIIINREEVHYTDQEENVLSSTTLLEESIDA